MKNTSNYKLIKTTLPKNADVQTVHIFEKRKFYKMPILKVKEVKNVFITHYGIVLKNLFPIRYTLPNAWGFRQPNSGFIWSFYKKALEIYLVCRFGKSLKQIKYNTSQKYLFIYSPWFGYFSWVTESLPRIFTVKNELVNYKLLLPESYINKAFVRDSLKMFPDLKIEVIPADVHVNVKNIVIPELKPFTFFFDPDTMSYYRQQVWEYIDTLDLQLKKYNRIYVSREKAKNRKLINEIEVIELFKSYNFEILSFEDFSFFEQVYLMKNCNLLAGVHGAGFANISFMDKGTKLFELIKEYSSYKEERPSYWRLCSALEIDYYIQYCCPVEYGKYDLWVGVDLIADTDKLKENLEKICS